MVHHSADTEAGAVADEHVRYWRSYMTAAECLRVLGQRSPSGGWQRVRRLLITHTLREPHVAASDDARLSRRPGGRHDAPER